MPVATWLADFKLDSTWCDAMVLKMLQGGEVYSEEETALIDSVAAGTGKVRLLRHSKTVESAWTKHDKKSGLLIACGDHDPRLAGADHRVPNALRPQDQTLSARPNR